MIQFRIGKGGINVVIVLCGSCTMMFMVTESSFDTNVSPMVAVPP
jgi:hypothetical protein